MQRRSRHFLSPELWRLRYNLGIRYIAGHLPSFMPVIVTLLGLFARLDTI